MDLADYRKRSLEVWDRMAPEWERRRHWVWEVSRSVGEWMVHELDPQRGQTILELAAGPGETGFVAAGDLGPDGRLISTDFSPEMVEAARRRAAELSVENAEFRVMDAEHMDLDDDSVDGVLCRWGYMLMSDPAAALAETRRVLRDGGRLAFSVWGAPERNPWAAISGAAMVGHGHLPAPEPGAPGMFSLADPERVRALVRGAGFSEARIEELPVEWRYENFEEYWSFVSQLAGACAMVIATLSDEEIEAVREAMREGLTDYRVNSAYVLPGVCLNCVAS